MLLFKDALGEFSGREMGDVFFGTRVFSVEVAIVGEEFGSWNFPGPIVFFPFGPPGDAVGEFFELDGSGFGVVLFTFGQGLFVIPDVFGGAGAVEEKDIGGDAGVGSEDAVGEADDGVEVEFFEEVFFDAGTDAVAEKGAVGDDDCSPRFAIEAIFRTAGCGDPAYRMAAEFAHDELEEEEGGFGGLFVFGEVALDAFLFFAAERWISEDDIDAIGFSDFGELESKGVAGIDLG